MTPLTRRVLKALAIGVAVPTALVLALRFHPAPRPSIDAPLELIAHRGVHQTFPLEGLDDTTCTAQRIHPPTHAFIENTIPSIAAAFEAGADRVEIDVHETADDHVIVFHDWTLDCRTDGKGVTREQTLATLKALDVGYGYTADGGRTFPLRGTGVGMMPTLEEVLEAFPNGRFLLNQKSGSVRTVEVLAQRLAAYGPEVHARLSYWGPLPDEARRRIPRLGEDFLDRGAIVRCVKGWFFSGGLGAIDDACAGRTWLFPDRLTGWLWGFPNHLVGRLVERDARLVLTEVDSIEEAEAARKLPIHGVMTNRIEVVGPPLRAHPRGP